MILYEARLFGNTRFLAQMSMGTMPHEKIMRSIELFGTRVAPEVRKALKTQESIEVARRSERTSDTLSQQDSGICRK